MSQKELSRLEVIQRVNDKRLKQTEAAEVLGLSVRQIKRLLKEYRLHGAAGLVSKKRGQPSNRRHSSDFKDEILEQVRQQYSDFGPTLAAEKLLERDELQVNRETLRLWMMKEGLWKGKQRKSSPIHQQRERRPSLGELVQIDGSPHDWFEGRADKCCLLVFVDDATSRLLQLRFEPSETTLGYYKATRDYISQHGRPLALYSDKYSVFRINKVDSLETNGETQFGRAMRELGIELICAHSPQAKGRVERANGTLQDRLVKELRLRGISDIDTANAYLPEFIEDYNKRFAVEPASPNDMHRRGLPSDEALDLIFTIQSERTLSKNLELSYNNVIYQVQTPGKGYGLRHAKVTVCDDAAGSVTLLYKGKKLEYTTMAKAQKMVEVAASKEINKKLDKAKAMTSDTRSRGHKPKESHPWRQYEKVAAKKERHKKKAA